MIRHDNPIEKFDEDEHDRDDLVESILQTIRTIDVSNGAVLALTGPWGSGKTSVLNLLRCKIESQNLAIKSNLNDETYYEEILFNPWMYSTRDDLAIIFLDEFSKQIGMKGYSVRKLMKFIGLFGVALRPLGGFVAGLGAIAIEAQASSNLNKRNAGYFKEEICVELRGIKKKKSLRFWRRNRENRNINFLVIIDDIDRLTPVETAEVLRLIKLVANFPNVFYILAFDRNRVEEALDGQGIPGTSYLEKIILQSFVMPTISRETIRGLCDSGVKELLKEFDRTIEDDQAWIETLYQIVAPCINNVRDLRRYMLALSSTLASTINEIDCIDVIAMEIIRVFEPKTFSVMASSISALTRPEISDLVEAQEERRCEKIKKIIDSSNGRSDLLFELISRVFPDGEMIEGSKKSSSGRESKPNAGRLRERKFLERYFCAFKSADYLDFELACKLLEKVTDEEQFRAELQLHSNEKKLKLIYELSRLKTGYPDFEVSGISAFVLNLYGELFPLVNRQSLESAVKSFVFSLLAHIGNERSNGTVESVFNSLEFLNSKGFFVLCLELDQTKTCDDETVNRLRQSIRDQIQDSSPDQLASESNLIDILGRYNEKSLNPSELYNLYDVPLLWEPVIRSMICAMELANSSNQSEMTTPERNEIKRLIGLFPNRPAISQMLQTIACDANIDEPVKRTVERIQGHLTRNPPVS